MASLKEFLRQQKESAGHSLQVNIGGRLKDYEFSIRALSYAEYSEIQQGAATVSAKGRVQINGAWLYEKIVLTCCLEPDFAHVDFLEENGCRTPGELLHALLKPGEVVELGKRIQRISGFDQDFEELVEEAKNA